MGGSLSEVPSLLMAAHEIKAPLVLIRQLSLQLEEDIQSEHVERIKLTAERSLRLVESLTKVSRLEDGLFATEPIAIKVIYDEVAHELHPLARALGQDIVIDVPNRSLVAVANPMLLRSILLGLCDNALTHNQTSQPVILRAQRRGERIKLGVRDHGPATDSLKYIRRHLGKTMMPLSSRPRSSGLGLMIAGKFAKSMNAELSLVRHRQAGATFYLTIPESKQLSLV